MLAHPAAVCQLFLLLWQLTQGRRVFAWVGVNSDDPFSIWPQKAIKVGF